MIDPDSITVAGYPADYDDPPWDGTKAGFRDVVLPAREAALARSFTAMLADMGFPEMRFEFTTEDAP